MATITSLGFSIFSHFDGSGVNQARRAINDLRGDLDRNTNVLNSWSGRLALAAKAAASLAPALKPIGGVLAGIGGAATAMGAAVGSALGIYGVVMKGAIDNTLKLAKAHKELTPVQKEFVASVNAMKAAMNGVSTGTMNMTLKTATVIVQGLTNVIKGMTPVIKAIHPLILGVAEDFKKWTEGSSFKNYVNLIKGAAVPALRDLIAAGKDVINVLGDGFRAFLPQGQGVTKVLREGAAALREWSDGGGFQRFIAYAKSNGPAVMSFFSALGGALKTLWGIMGQLSGTSLQFATDILRLIAAMNPATVVAFGQAFLAIRSPMAWILFNCPAIRDLIISLVGAMNPATVYAFAAAFVAVRVAIALVNAEMLSTPVGWLIAGLAALAVGIVFLATKTQFFQTVWQGLVAAWNFVLAGMKQSWADFSGFFVAAWNIFWGGLVQAVTAIWAGLTAAWNAVVFGLSTAWTTTSAALVAAWNAVWNGMSAAARAIWAALQAAWNAVCTAFTTAWNATSAALHAAWNAVWNAMKAAAEAVWNALKAAWSAFLTAINTTWNTISAVLKAAWNAAWAAIKLAAETVWNALKLAWSTFLTAINTAWTTASAALKTAWSAVWNAVKTAAETVWNAIKAAWSAFLKAIETALNAAKSAIEGVWKAIWSALESAAKAAWDKITGVIKGAIDKITSIIKSVGNFINKISSAVGLGNIIPGLANGGVVNFKYGGMVGKAPGFATGGTVNFSQGGGVLKGYEPGRDRVPAMLSRGEGVLVPEAVRGLGGAGFVHWANRHFSNGRGGQGGFTGYGAYGRAYSDAMGQKMTKPKGCKGGNCGKSGSAHNWSKQPRYGSWSRQPGGRISHFADGGVAGLGGIQAWHRTGPANGWDFANGGIMQAFATGGLPTAGHPVPDPNTGNAKKDGSPSTAIGGVVGDIMNTITGGLLGGGGGVSSLVLGFIEDKVFDQILDAGLKLLSGFGLAGKFGEVLVAAVKKILKAAVDFLKKKNEEARKKYEAMAVAGSKSCAAWMPVIVKALQITGAPASWAGGIDRLLCAESGGNPNAINNWDSNAKAGIPSQGLMQVIPPTFQAYHQPGTSNNILDPLANIAAAINYIKARYGYVPGSPYASGTTNATPGTHLVGEKGPELVMGPTMANFGGGETVLSAGDTSSYLGNLMQGAVSSTMQGLSTGELSPEAAKALFDEITQAAQAMQAAVQASWTATTSASATGWSTASSSYTGLQTASGTSVPASLTAMSTAATTAWTTMGTAVAAQWGAMRDTTFAEAQDYTSVKMPGWATTMQSSVQGSWDTLSAGTTTSWTGIQTEITKDVTAATTPINGLLTGFNNVSSALGIGSSIPLIQFSTGGVAGYHRGGVIPGYAPGKDTVPAILSKGEGILTPEAVRGLGGPGFVHAANRKFAGHRGAGRGANPWSQYCGVDSKKEGLALGGVLHFAGGGTITAQDLSALAEAGVSPGLVTQGSFNTSVAASGSTHAGDGVVDLGTSDTGTLGQLTNNGWAAWIRTPAEGFAYHTHAISMKASGIDPSAQGQVISYINGGTGLPAGSASSAELAGWGLGLGRWDFGPLIKDIVKGNKKTVPPKLKPTVLKKLTGEQVKSGFAELKAACDAMQVGTGMFADGLKGMGNKTHQGIVDYITKRAVTMDGGGWMQPGMNHVWNGTGKPELATPADDLAKLSENLRGHRECHSHGDVNVHFHGPTTEEAVRRAETQMAPKLRAMMQQGTGKRCG